MERLTVLVVGMTNKVGGLENFVLQYCRRMTAENVRFDFLSRFPDCVYADRIAQMGGKLYTVTRRSRNPFRFYREIRAFFAAHGREYDVVWDNETMMNDMTPLRLAAKAGVPVRIYHSHNAANMDPSLKGRAQELLHRLHRRGLPRYATALWACSREAVRWAYPRGDMPAWVIPNAIDTADFAYSPEVRAACRRELGLEDSFVVGNVGRLQYAKNQRFLLEAFAGLHRINGRARLLLVGEGPDREALTRRAGALGLAESVLMPGFREDAARLLQAMDVFAFPSLFEGLGIAAVEAQAAGLPCLLSEAVPRAAGVTELASFLPVDDPAIWAEAMARAQSAPERRDHSGEVARAGLDIVEAAQALTARLFQLRARAGEASRG